MFKINKMTAVTLCLISSSIGFIGCADSAKLAESAAGGGSVSLSALSSSIKPDFSVELLSGTTSIYNQANNSGVFQMESGKSYNLKVSTPATTQLSLKIKNSTGSLVTSSPVPLSPGNNSFPMSGVGTLPIGMYTFQVDAVEPSSIPPITNSHSYTVAVTCNQANQNSFAVNSNVITASGNINMYTLNFAGIASGGTGSYKYRVDFNGDGVPDTNLSTSTSVSDYSNHIRNRPVSVYVTDDACLVTKVATKTVTYNGPANRAQFQSQLAGQVFIAANVTSSSTDKRINNVTHVSTNAVQPVKVDCMYSRGSNGTGTFRVDGVHKYVTSTSEYHGMSITFDNLVENINWTTHTGTLNASSSKVSEFKFGTDLLPDSSSKMTFIGNQAQCTGTITPVVENVTGTPCNDGTGHINGGFTVKATGIFQCSSVGTSNAPGTTINVNDGAFFCEYHIADSCVGGGGGGGGIVPIRL